MNEKRTVALGDINFVPITDREQIIIENARKKSYAWGFKKRLIVSLIVTVICIISEIYAHITYSALGSATPMIIFISVAFAVFNLISFGYVQLKKRMSLYTEHMSFIEGIVSTKYDHITLSNENKQKSGDFILFDYDKNHCKDAVRIDDPDEFKALKTGTPIIIVRSEMYGDYTYKVYMI